MNAATFRSFVKTAAELQLRDDDVSSDYLRVHAAVLEKYPTLQKLSSWGEMAGHAAEVGGLGILAAPTVQHLRGEKKEMSDRKKAAYELGGLGVLAAPSAVKLYQHFRGM